MHTCVPLTAISVRPYALAHKVDGLEEEEDAKTPPAHTQVTATAVGTHFTPVIANGTALCMRIRNSLIVH